MRKALIITLFACLSVCIKAQVSAQDIVFDNNSYSVVIPFEGYKAEQLYKKLYYATFKSYCINNRGIRCEFLSVRDANANPKNMITSDSYFYFNVNNLVAYTTIAECKENKIRFELIFKSFVNEQALSEYSYNNFRSNKPEYDTLLRNKYAEYLNNLIANTKSHDINW